MHGCVIIWEMLGVEEGCETIAFRVNTAYNINSVQQELNLNYDRNNGENMFGLCAETKR